MKIPTIIIPTILLITMGTGLWLSNKPERIDQKTISGWSAKKAVVLRKLNSKEKKKMDEAILSINFSTTKNLSPKKVLVFYRCGGFVHPSITHANYALQKLGEQSGQYQVALSDDYRDLRSDNLSSYDLLLFNNSTSLRFKENTLKKSILSHLKGGKGIAGIHGASDSFYHWEQGTEIFGAQFDKHPWKEKGNWSFQIDLPQHPINSSFRESGKQFFHRDEIYQYKISKDLPKTILISLDFGDETTAQQKDKDSPLSIPVSWIREPAVGGRVFYSNFGHRPETFANHAILEHFHRGIMYCLKLL